jgi:hypothetical protein
MTPTEARQRVDQATADAAIGDLLAWASIPADSVADIASARRWYELPDATALLHALRDHCREAITGRLLAGEINL